jgi:hypothetical protein
MVAIALRKLYAKTKVGKTWNCMMFIDSRMMTGEVFLLWDQNTWNTFSGSEEQTIIKDE